jgi:hypothetical protein
VDFSIRLARAAAWMTWLCLIVSIAAVALMDHYGAPAGVVLHPTAYYLWAAFGVLATTFLTFLPTLAMRSHFVLKNINVFRALLLISDTVWATAGGSVTGGIHGPFWVCYLGIVLFAAVSMPAWQAAAFGFACSGGVVLSSAIAHTLTRDAVGSLVLVCAIFPIVAWFNSSLSAAVWSLRSKAREERKVLEARVADLSAVL